MRHIVLVGLLALIGLLVFPGQAPVSEVKAEQPVTAPQVVPDLATIISEPAYVGSVYRVRLTAPSGIANGSAVAVRSNVLHTAKHLADGLNGFRAEVEIDGQWRQATWNPAQGDVATLAVNGEPLNPVEVKIPTYGQRVTVYGLRTKSSAVGTYIGAGMVALDACEPHVDSGDSGGGVFSESGDLLGTISGYMTASNQVTLMTPIEKRAEPNKAPTPVETPKAPIAISAPKLQSGCPGGVCPVPQARQQYIVPRRGWR